MKKLRLNLVMIAVVAGAIGAFAFKPAHKSAGGSYYWFQYNDAGTMLIYPNTEPALGSDPFGCDGSTTNCASGYNGVQEVGGVYEPTGPAQQTDQKD